MNTLSMNHSYVSRDPSRRIKGIIIVVALHAFLGYALVSGMARKGLNLIKKPLEAVVIQEVIIPPPPPPPPKKIETPKEMPKVDAPPPPYVPPPEVTPQVSNAPTMVSRATPPPEPLVIAPPPALVVTGLKRTSIGVACPTQVAPEMPRKALQDGVEGVVKAQVLIKDGAVKEVTILSGPRIFHAVVRAAMMQYKCTQDAGDILATQEFNFKVE
jgi:periplasmic protein TonB